VSKEIKFPPFHLTVNGNASLVIDGLETGRPVITFHDTFECKFKDPRPQVLNVQMKLPSDVSSKLLADDQLLEEWANTIRKTIRVVMPEQIILAAHVSLSTAFVSALNEHGLDSVDMRKEVAVLVRESARWLKDSLDISGRGRRPLWSKEELEQATRKAVASIRRKKKYGGDPQLSDIADVFNKRFPDRGTFTANSVRQLLNRNGIRWRVLWKEIRNAQK
jgi:CRISPR/Cas system-associated endonuclease Cas1